jgi:hypothetical protein
MYSGDGNYNGSTSGILPQVVNANNQPWIVNISLLGNTNLQISGAGIANASYTLYSTNMLNASNPWPPIANTNADLDGIFQFNLSPSVGAAQFYKVGSP